MSRLPGPAGDLAAKADEVAAFLNEQTERLNFENYDGLRETEVMLRELARYLAAADPQAHLMEQLQRADEELKFFTHHLGVRPLTGEGEP
ncbi:hypothetical protein [Lignipirellula cremea]|uniref:Uncharacterized protein n=1 Tax=Lignipirellula cremea TaxID=2528010 RepID=A0A518E3D0_9BACT|nr:hypothetical protein [Lignipirellula cremea]QDU98594.1 hypothetical protein Pla8534_64650 [Lignipirellula cremea]